MTASSPIVVVEPFWPGLTHAPGNAGTISIVAEAFPGRHVQFLGEAAQVAEMRRIFPTLLGGRLTLNSFSILPITVKGIARIGSEIRLLRRLSGMIAGADDALIVFASVTPTLIRLLGPWLALQGRKRIGIHLRLHGNLNEINDWRSRNPVRRTFDMRSALTTLTHPAIRLVVIEEPVAAALADAIPRLARQVDVLEESIDPAESETATNPDLAAPIRFGYLGLGTEAKGLDLFLDAARQIRQRYGDRAEFHLIGRPHASMADLDFSALAELPGTAFVPRETFCRRLADMHYVCLPYRPGKWYELGASGVLVDAISFRKPIIATATPTIESLAARYGDVGIVLKHGDSLADPIAALIEILDAERYDARQRAMSAARNARLPAALAAKYASIAAAVFPTLKL